MHPGVEAVSSLSCMGQGWMGRGGAALGVIRSRQGTEAMSYQLGLAAGRWRQAHSFLSSSPCAPPLLWSPCPLPGAPSLWPCSWLCRKVSLPSLTCYSSRPTPSGAACRCLPPQFPVLAGQLGALRGGSPAATAALGSLARTELLQSTDSTGPSHLALLGLPPGWPGAPEQ